MGTKPFANFLIYIQHHISCLNFNVGRLEDQVMEITERSESEGSGSNSGQVTHDLLAETQEKLSKTRMAIKELKNFFVKMKKEWTKPEDRVIGHVDWAPPISVSESTTSHSYTKDVCVIKLDEKKFKQNFMRNVLDLGVCQFVQL